MSEALNISTHLTNSSSSTSYSKDNTPSLLLEAYRLARRQGNLKHAQYLIQRQIFGLTGEADGAVDVLNASSDISPIEKLRIVRERAKLCTSQGQPAMAVDLLSTSVVNYCEPQQGTKTTGPLGSGSELAARSLLAMVKWMQSDSRLMLTVWNSESTQKLHKLLMSEHECRKARMGLYKSTSTSESFELFKPDESVARFDKNEYSIGQLLHLSTIYCPDLAKAWWALAGWCYRIGRKNLEALRYK